MVSGPFTTLFLNRTPPWLDWRVAGPAMVLPAQAGATLSPTTTRPLVLEIESGPINDIPQIRIAVAPVLVSRPVTVTGALPPITSSAPPADTLMFALIENPGARHTAWPAM